MSEMQPVNNPVPNQNSVLNQVQNAYRNNPMQTLAIGMGVAVLAPAVLPLMKPLAKAAIKSGVGFYEKTKGAIAETGEVIGDIVAEAKAEAAAEQAQKISVASGLMNAASNSNETQGN
ncbi:conserved hypothetical protein [Hyella patelloides LEGE 07179]|uniref:DUF5132 domain-containing protein n=1 Tax=Hyella patelloides LEGE 07179 TaxID=945734 RepID=A0A563VMX7_9CYAN|nr:DUF5132 domain-containing protein [Hyella patelloides]VEP12789.1 conserved hypothetical protein [Hyella patelloides LEGE 07179]